VDGELGFSRLFVGGGRLVASLGANLFRFVSTGDGWDTISNLSLAFTQPLLSGSGRLVATEALTQAERDLVYEVRSFERFRRSFSVDVARRMYDLLEALEQLENQRRNYQGLVVLRERNEALAEAGRLSDIQVDQARQNELRSENQILSQEADLRRRFDDFKLFLGLPIETPIRLDPGEFERLVAEDPLLERLDDATGIEIALAERLDLLNTHGVLEDRGRRVAIAEDDLRAGLDLTLAADSTSDVGRPASFALDRTAWTAGLTLDLPIDKIAERNALRRSLIDLEAARRELERSSDQIDADVRDSLRRARTTRQSHVIQVGAVALGERRVASAELNLQAGRASTRDLLEAQDDLLEARNAATSALIDFTLARLELYLDLEMSRVDEAGIGVAPELDERLREERR
jgi:outer membrane protein TolC